MNCRLALYLKNYCRCVWCSSLCFPNLWNFGLYTESSETKPKLKMVATICQYIIIAYILITDLVSMGVLYHGWMFWTRMSESAMWRTVLRRSKFQTRINRRHEVVAVVSPNVLKLSVFCFEFLWFLLVSSSRKTFCWTTFTSRPGNATNGGFHVCCGFVKRSGAVCYLESDCMRAGLKHCGLQCALRSVFGCALASQYNLGWPEWGDSSLSRLVL